MLERGILMESFVNRQEHVINYQDAVACMLRDYCNFVGMKTQIQGVQDATAAWNSEKRLQMFGVIPHHRRDTVTRLHSQFRQGIGKPPGPAMEFAVAGASDGLVRLS